jgi:hypothetical protein
MAISKSAIKRSFIDRLRGWKQRAFWRTFVAINKVYTKLFSHELSRFHELSGLKDFRTPFEDILARNPAIASLNKEKNYFLLHASYGDKWCILSFLAEHFSRYSNSFVIACHQDRGLIEIFLGPTTTAERFIFIDLDPLNQLSGFFRPVSKLSMPLADVWYTEGCKMIVTSFFIDHGLPPGTIRHLHIVYYPYFNEFSGLHGVSYATLLKVLLYLPATTKSSLPAYYSEHDYLAAKGISWSSNLNASSPLLPSVLFNVVNFSQMPLATAQISLLTSLLEKHGYRVLLNVTQSAGFEELTSLVSANHRDAVFVSVPPTLLALVCDNVHAVIGVLGGAMNVAVQFSGAHVLSLQTPAIFTGCSEDELYAEWGKERIWEWVDKDWPCLHPGRVVVNTFIGDPAILADKELTQALQSFLQQLPAPEPRQLNVL